MEPTVLKRSRMNTTAFLTDSTLCIGCKACEVACKEWNRNLGGWIRVEWPFLRQHGRARPFHLASREIRRKRSRAWSWWKRTGNRPWAFSSDVCKHCEDAGCLEACPTGAIVRTEFGGVYIQPDVCNGCGYCVVSCPFGVVERNPDDGRAFKCTFCYDRQKPGCNPLAPPPAPPNRFSFGELMTCDSPHTNE